MFRLKEVLPTRSICPPPAFGLVALAVCLAVHCYDTAWALGTPAGTIIANTAQVTYTLQGSDAPQSVAARHDFSVVEVIDAVLTWQDGAPLAVNSPHVQRSLAFLLTNTGNGPETFLLSPRDRLDGDQFDPEIAALWKESNGTAGLQTTGGTPDTPITDDRVALAADQAVLIYLSCNIPADLSDQDVGQVALAATAVTPGAAGAAPGTFLAGTGTAGGDAVVGSSGGRAEVQGAFVVAVFAVTIAKSIARIEDPLGGSEPYPGAQVTYRLAVTVSESGTAEDLTITDAIPESMTYLPGSIVLDGASQTDAHDPATDASDFNVSANNTITVHLGDTAAPAVRTIEFTATIN